VEIRGKSLLRSAVKWERHKTTFTKLMLTQQIFVKNSYIKIHVNKKNVYSLMPCHRRTDARTWFPYKRFLLHKERRKSIYDLFVVCLCVCLCVRDRERERERKRERVRSTERAIGSGRVELAARVLCHVLYVKTH